MRFYHCSYYVRFLHLQPQEGSEFFGMSSITFDNFLCFWFRCTLGLSFTFSTLAISLKFLNSIYGNGRDHTPGVKSFLSLPLILSLDSGQSQKLFKSYMSSKFEIHLKCILCITSSSEHLLIFPIQSNHNVRDFARVIFFKTSNTLISCL